MKGFPGQLTGLGLNATQGLTWQIVPFYIQSLLRTMVRAAAAFMGTVD